MSVSKLWLPDTSDRVGVGVGVNSWKAEEKRYFFKRNGVFFSFFFSRNNQTQEIVYSIFFFQSWWPTCCLCGCDSFDEWEKRLGNSPFETFSDGLSCSVLGFPLWSYNKSQNNTSTIQLLKQRLKDRKCSLDFKTFL